jgi:hypothetical protein
MKSLQLIAIFLIIISVGYFVQSNQLLQDNKAEKPVSGASDVKKEAATKDAAPTLDEDIVKSPTEVIGPEEKISEDGLSGYYPGAVVESRNGTTVTLRSTDSAEIITEWYEAYIKNNNMTTKTFVKTKTNGVVQNKLTGVSNTDEIAVDIQKEQDSDTIIKLNTKSY